MTISVTSSTSPGETVAPSWSVTLVNCPISRIHSLSLAMNALAFSASVPSLTSKTRSAARARLYWRSSMNSSRRKGVMIESVEA
ncbi:hypothetical protein TVAG_228340 [Trichomonas vaginalis G3]|uniref:Uncharacterized protein n=1 Tax=Trichomonas vaginalis (strain ATCC PRA-98 / G3) TaxID=412133 RepID=A2DIZ4_TRIV3|nr:hypothetical protein TVAGG3_0483830 [Trichomonas vaginalis G3]XP_001580557.1 hypothetical protein TVAGG3_0483850 [Trichomonas vaginalis G3]EAY19569.1 hypothetical protein TVAG_228320 [Trichomonas vaginalis G3]EAY19571.1 hypothetical protein TVAG_228340 [Trichomonas vaginalis G3]KAI5515898.1 hypothetical protein TVAGG3_0483830 [Trichomonas vaginalis G3]KAI5515900.1 hypothetical protein TVAGG3_0483850 [Trichomonas vaginalis G3]|eukprot:XP_001580555.1 hypothetical protein [Trichomonas vaginalis G3]